MRTAKRLLLAAAFCIGCASGGGADGNDSAASSGIDCPDGEETCPCYGNGTCNEGLECISDLDRCVAESCTAGAEGCTCVDGLCLGELTCEDGLCAAGSGATSTTASTEATSSPATDGGSTTDGLTSGTSSSGSTGTNVCQEQTTDCVECQQCAATADCFAQVQECLAVDACSTFVTCLMDCATRDCQQACCDANLEGAMYATELFACVNESCKKCRPTQCG